jgi:hypothetical protein
MVYLCDKYPEDNHIAKDGILWRASQTDMGTVVVAQEKK